MYYYFQTIEIKRVQYSYLQHICNTYMPLYNYFMKFQITAIFTLIFLSQ